MIEHQEIGTEKNVVTTKWDVLIDLQKRIDDVSRRIGFCENKVANKTQYLGDPYADLEAAKKQLPELRRMYVAVLESKGER